MSNNEKTLNLNENDVDALKLIGAFITQANKEFQSLSLEAAVQFLDYHNKGHSLNYCLRWGEQACRELIENYESRQLTHPESQEAVALSQIDAGANEPEQMTSSSCSNDISNLIDFMFEIEPQTT